MARRPSPKPFQRTDRIAELIRSIVASELERIGDERLDLVTVTAVKVDGSLDHAEVFYSALSAQEDGRLDSVEEALDDVRWPVQQVINRQVRARRTPQITFRRDEVLLEAMRIEELLADIRSDSEDVAAEDGAAEDGTDGGSDDASDSPPEGGA